MAAGAAGSVFGLKVHDIFLVIVCFQFGFFGYQFLLRKDDVRLPVHHRIHHEESKRDFFQPFPKKQAMAKGGFIIQETPLESDHEDIERVAKEKSPVLVAASSIEAAAVHHEEEPQLIQNREEEGQETPEDPDNGGGDAAAPPSPKRLNREQKRVKRLQRRQRRAAVQGTYNLTGPLYQENYFSLARNLYPEFSLVPELLPLKIMMKYVTDFSQQQLEKMWRECGNTPCPSLQRVNFIVGTYSCPLEAGNRLHKFMNSLIWAVTTRRFFLWRYFDETACREEEAELATGTCDSFLNTREDCADILQLSDWVPSWDEWSVKLNLTHEPTVRACGIGTRDHDGLAFALDEQDDKPRLLRVGQQLNLETAVVLGNPNNLYGKRLLVKKSSQSIALQLFKQGNYFTYGMLFESLFALHPSLLPSSDLVETVQEADSYFIHSRHPPSRGDASEISLELLCMERLLLNRLHPQDPCKVVIMTDREVTKPLLARALQETYNCTALSANTTQGSASFRTEHGPFAGRGYFEDLALVMQTRTGFLAPHKALRSGIGIRTSSGLPREIVEFRRVLESATWDDIPSYAECVGAYDDTVDGNATSDGENAFE
jgi:hypothetical protein